jgi:hypothetical protein
MGDRTKYALTAAQRDELGRLLRLGALDRESALSAYDPGMGASNANVLGILIEKGFALKRTRTRSRVARTVYWLTDAGAVEARKLRSERA